MDEPAVFERVVDEARDRGYDPMVHVPSAHEDRFRGVLQRCPAHRISIRGRYPDVVGFTPSNRVFAVEVKGAADLQRGIGQALTYQRGAHYSYLAADARAVEEVADLAAANGLGVVGVSEAGLEWREPNPTTVRDLLPDVEGQLRYRLRRRGSAGRITGMTLAQPLNFLAPALAVGEGDRPRGEVAARIEADYGLAATDGAIDGAAVLGLVEARGDRLALTEQGELAAAALAGCGVSSLGALRELKEGIPRGETLADHHPTVATLLRTLMLGHPEVRLLVGALAELDREVVRLPELIEHLVGHYPNVFLNLFCTEAGRERARGLLEAGSAERLHEEEATWKDVVRANVVFNFVHQLRHAGILDSRTSGHGRAFDEYDPDEKPWYVGRVEP